VLILYHFRTRGTGPEAVHISGVASAFEALGHRVVFSSPTGVDPRLTAGSSPYAATRTTRLPGVVHELLEIAYNAFSFFRNAGLLLSKRPGLVYERHAFFLCSTAVLCRLTGRPLVVEVNELLGDARVREQPALSTLARLADRVTFHVASLIVVVSPHLARRLVSQGVEASRILVQPNAVRREDVESTDDGQAVRERLGLRADAVLVGFVGWFVAWHRLDKLLEVFANVASTNPSLRLLLVGEGPLESSLRQQCEELSISDRVTFNGPVSHDAVGEHVAAMDVCVVPPSNEYRSPIKLFEYMAQGKAVVAPATEPIASVAADGSQALLFPPGDFEAMAAALRRLAGDPDLRSQLGQNARALVLEKHTWDRNAAEVLSRLEAPRTDR